MWSKVRYLLRWVWVKLKAPDDPDDEGGKRMKVFDWQ